LSEIHPSDSPASQANSTSRQAPEPLPPDTIRDIFLGADGLRAGWGMILFVALSVAMVFLLGSVTQTIEDLYHGPETAPATQTQPGTQSEASMAPGFIFRSEGVACVGVLLATWLMAKIERRPLATYGFRRQRRTRNFLAGFAWGVALLSLLVILLRATGFLVFDQRLLSGSSIARYGAIWLGNFLIIALFEELVSRGYPQFTLTRGLSGLYRWLFRTAYANTLGFWTAALVLSFAFGLNHGSNPGESPLGLLSAGLIGLLWCFSLWRTGSLWWAIGFHMAWDWAESFLYGVADSGLMIKGHLLATHPVGQAYLSGGVTGPEGSLLLLPVALAGVAVIFFTLPRTNSGYQPVGAANPSLH
jgi:uncharacterized protein